MIGMQLNFMATYLYFTFYLEEIFYTHCIMHIISFHVLTITDMCSML